MRKFLLFLICPVVFLAGGGIHAQDYSNKGKDFWVIYTGHIDGTSSRMALYITSDQNASGTLSVGGSTLNFTVTANQVTTLRLTNTSTPNNSLAYNAQTTGIGANRGIHIVSDNDIVVYAHILNAARSGSTLVLPTKVLGKEYYVSSYAANSGSNSRSQFAVVATTDNTTIEITPKLADAGNTYPANVPFQITLNRGDVFQYQSANSTDLTGSFVKSIAAAGSACKPIAVFSGSTFTPMGCAAANSGDNLYQQLFPSVSWGQFYITAPFILRAYDIFRIMVKDPTTIVQVNGVTLNPATLINSTFYEINTIGNNTSRIITADKPICVLQYLITQACDGVQSDPEMIILNSIEQTIKDITVLSARNDLTPPATNISSHYLNIIVPTSALGSLLIDGAPYTSTPVPIVTTSYSYIRENITASTLVNPTHRVTCDSGFLATAYGYGNVESYGYNAGTNVRDLYQFVTIHNQYGTVNFPAGCKNSPFNFSMTFPYQPTQIQWVFGPLLNAMGIADTLIGPVPAPVFDSSWVVNGKTLYRYKLPSSYIINLSGTYPIKVLAQNPTPDGCSGQQEINYDLQVFDPPLADFTFTTNGCVPTPVDFLDNSNTGGRPVISRHWNFGDGITTGINNPTHLYAGPGAYNVKYALITDIGCLSDTALHVVTIDNPPVARFGASYPDCVNKVITFSDSSTVSGGAIIVKWYWDFGDGSPLVVATTNINQTHTYTATGTYNVTLKVETTAGCQSLVFTLPVTINTNPVADFSFPNICLPVGLAQFTDLSTIGGGSAITGWLWDFGDGSPTSGLQNPTHNYSGMGPYTVTLIVTSNSGCQDTKSRIVNTIYAEPQAAFTYPPEVCLETVANFIDNSVAAGSSVTQWAWNFGDGSPVSTVQNPSHVYAVAGTYTVTLNVTSAIGCQTVNNNATHIVVVNPLPTVNFNYTAPTCETVILNFTDMSVANAGTINSWTWNFGDGSPVSNLQNPTHTFANAGTYNVTLQVNTTKGCLSTVFTRQVTVSPKPLPGFILPEVCLSDAFAQFTDTSSVASGSIVAWAWNFGDPASGPLNTSTLQHPQHRYNAIGNYTVTLIVTSNNGCVSVIVQTITVNGDIPAANFNALNPASLCANDSVAIQDASTVNFGNITKVEIYWDNIGAPAVVQVDDFPFAGKVYTHLYPNFQSPLTRIFTIRYKAYSGATCVNERIKTITVNAAPLVQFNSMPNVCLDAAPFQLTQASETGGVPGTAIFTGTGVSPLGIFDPAAAGPGTHQITYTFTSTAGGCVDSLSNTIMVYEPAIADFTFTGPFCETKAITFTDNSSAPVGTLTTWTWDFSDGSPVLIRTSGAPFTHTFANWGVYWVKLTVTTSNGCVSAQKLFNVTVNPQPKVNFSIPASACLPDASVAFVNLSSIADGTQASFTYVWDFDDPPSGAANTSVLANPSHVYASTGPFNVRLEVTSGNGCVHDTTIVLNTIHPQPIASFTVDKIDVCIGGSFVFNNTSDPLDGTITQYNWLLGDGNSNSIPGFTHTYNTVGTYNVSLFIFNSHGCRSTTAVKTVFVNPYPSVNAGPDKFMLEGGQVILTPVVTSGMPVSYLWAPPTNLNNPTLVTPVATPPADITYTLTVTSDKGCSAADQVFVKVLKAPEIPNIFSPNGDGIHDKWIIAFLESYPGCTVDIFNRYGQQLYHSVGYADPWDGKINGRDVPVGTYYYIVNPKNGRKIMSGYVDVIR